MAKRSNNVNCRTVATFGLALATGVCSVLAVAPAVGAYQVAFAPAIVAAGAAIPVAVAFVGSRTFKLSSSSTLAISFAAMIALAFAAAGANPAVLASVLYRGPRELLTETLPLRGGVSILVPLLVVEWSAAALSAEILARARTASVNSVGRSSTVSGTPLAAAALSIPAIVYVGSYAVSSALPSPGHGGGPELLVAIAAAAAMFHIIQEPDATKGQVLQAGTGPVGPDPVSIGAEFGYMLEPGDKVDRVSRSKLSIALRATLASAVVASILAFLSPGNPRGESKSAVLHLQAQVVNPVIDDPLDEMARFRDKNAAHPLSVGSLHISGPSAGYLQTAVLDDYTGGYWSFDATFSPTGGRVPLSATGIPRSALRVEEQVQLDARLPDPLLPAVGRPVEVEGTAVAADPSTGMLLEDTSSPRVNYTVVSEAPSVTFGQVSASAQIDLSAGTTYDLELPAHTQSYVAATVGFISYLTGLKPNATTAFLLAGLRALRASDKWVDPALSSSPPLEGTSLAQVINAVTVERAATPEQFATFFAVVARSLGVPARVVTGFRLKGHRPGGVLAAGTYQLSSDQAWAWVELPIVGIGWVVADPTPSTPTAVARPPAEPAQTVPTTVAPPRAVAAPVGGLGEQHAVASPASTGGRGESGVSVGVLIGGGAGVVVGLAVIVLAGGPSLRRRIRRRRRLGADPPGQAVGAWSEILERVERAGGHVTVAATNAEVAAELANLYGPVIFEPAAQVAKLAERAVFNPSAQIDVIDIEGLWDAECQVRAAIEMRPLRAVAARLRRIFTGRSPIEATLGSGVRR